MAAMEHYDLVVVGAGLAGLTAGMIGSRYGLKTAIVERLASGGQVLNIDKIENFPGFPQGIAGYDLGPLGQEQAEQTGVAFVIDTAIRLEVTNAEPIVHCDSTALTARVVIIAAGSSLRTLGIPGEEEFYGRGVSRCAS